MLTGCGSTLVDHGAGDLILPINPCPQGYHECGAGNCVLQDETSCAADCQPCAAQANARVSCNAGTCQYICATGFHDCGAGCVPEDASSCGASCAPCAALPGTTVACVAGACSYACDLGGTTGARGHLCGGSCVAESAASCGPSCDDCRVTRPAPPNGASACVDHACAITCEPGFLKCGDGCCKATAIAAGAAHTCAITETSATVPATVKCWGSDASGQLGNGSASTADAASPVTASLPGNIAGLAVSAGASHTCAVGAGGGAYCWGDNAQKQLGVGASGVAALDAPAPVFSLESGVTGIAAGGDHTCALLATGRVKCWGANDRGQVGRGTPSAAPVDTPSDVALPAGATVTAIAAGGSHTCALLTGGAVWCWGANVSGQVGNATTDNAPAPVAVTLNGPVRAIAAGLSHSIAGYVATDADGWGRNTEAQIGRTRAGFTEVNSSPVANRDLNFAVAELTAGAKHSCAIAVGGLETFQCWGNDAFGQLGARVPTEAGVPATGQTVHPSLPPPAASAKHVAAGGEHTCAIGDTGAVACWGRNDHGQVGTGGAIPGANQLTPAAISGQ